MQNNISKINIEMEFLTFGALNVYLICFNWQNQI
jgi:hypothetical protein